MQNLEEEAVIEKNKTCLTATTPKRRKSVNAVKGTWARAGSAIAYFHKRPAPSNAVEAM